MGGVVAKQRAKILTRLIILEREVYAVDFEKMKYQGTSIGDILDE